VSRIVSRSEVDRLGKRGSYRLGGLAQQGLRGPQPPRPYRMSFAGPEHYGSVTGWILAAIAGLALVALGALAGMWFVPFVAGLVAGLAMRWGGWRVRASVPAVLLMTAGGWGLALWIQALRGLPVGATARIIAALAGLPAYAAVTVAVTLVVSAVLGLAGFWLGRALTPRPARD
jgi:hypothetical protein